MKKIILTSEQARQLFICISTRIGFIETGTIHRAKNLKNDPKFKPNVLSSDQMKLIVDLEKLMDKLLQ